MFKGSKENRRTSKLKRRFVFGDRRDYSNPMYKRFRKVVRDRDGRKCQFPGCKSTKTIQVHHILPWADFPHLRFEPDNGICLCNECHARIRGNEYAHVKNFSEIVQRNKRKQMEEGKDIE